MARHPRSRLLTGTAYARSQEARSARTAVALGGTPAPTPTPTPVPTIAFAQAVSLVGEGNSGTKPVTNTINVTRNGFVGDVVVSLSVGGTATAGSDYEPIGATVTVPAGQNSVPLTVNVIGDALAEANETIVVTSTVGTSTAIWSITVTNDDAGGGAATLSNPRTDMHGAFLIFDVAGGTWSAADGINVDPSKVAIAVTAPSVNAAGVANTPAFLRRAGLRAEYVAGSPGQLKVWLSTPIFAEMTGLTVSVEAGAITSGADTNAAFTAAAAVNNAIHGIPTAAGHIVGVTEGRTSLLVEHGVVRNPWRAEAAGLHQEGIAGVEWTITKAGQSPVVSWQGEERRSIYQDRVNISDTQWASNVAGGEGGLGVWPSPTGAPATDPTGAVTVTALIVPKLGGRGAARTETWTIYSAQAGAYPERVIYLDTVAGSDSNTGLTAGAAKATIGAACLAAGSVSGGATQQTAGVVAIVGGTSGSPRDVDIAGLPATGSGNSIPGSTDTYLTLRPAPGFARDTIRLVNFAGNSNGVQSRIRRLRVNDLILDIADSATGFSSKAFFNAHTGVYPPASNPQSVWLDDCELTHRKGKTGHITTHSSVSVFGFTFERRNGLHATKFYHHDTGLYAFSSSGGGLFRDVRAVRFYKDTVKGPNNIFGFYAEDNAVDPYALPLIEVTGTPQPGDIMTGVFSWPLQATVTEYVATSGTAGVVKVAEGNVRQFKPDDAKDHYEVVVTGVSGSFQIGEVVRNVANSSQTFQLYRKDGATVLRGVMTGGGTFNAGITVQGATSGATATVQTAQTRTGNIFFSTSGARAKGSNPHPDGVQIQPFFPHVLTLKDISGSFNVGDTVSLQLVLNAANTSLGVVATGAIAAVAGSTITVGGNLNWIEGSTNAGAVQVTAGAGAGATATLVWAKAIDNDQNLLIANGELRAIDGQLLFGENGSANVGIYNILGVKADGAAAHQSQFSNIPGLTIAHVTLPNQNLVFRYFREWMPAPGATFRNVIAVSSGSSYRAPGMLTADNKGAPGKFARLHQIDGSSGFPNQPGAISSGAVTFVDGLGPGDSDNIARQDFRPIGAPPANTAVAPDDRLVRYDLRGAAHPDGGWPGAIASAG